MPRSGSPSSGGNTGLRVVSIYGDSGGGGRRPPQAAPLPPTPTPTPTPTPDVRPGVLTVDVTSPIGLGKAMGDNARATAAMAQGLQASVFGVAPEGGENQGGIPLIADLGRAVGRVPVANVLVGGVGDVLGNVLGGAAAAVGYVATHAQTTEVTPQMRAAGVTQTPLQQQFAAIPDSPEKQAVLAGMTADPGSSAHQMYEFTKAFNDQKQHTYEAADPTLAGVFTPSDSLADNLSNMLQGLGLTVRPIERTIAQGKRGDEGLDRLEQIEAVEKGAVYTGFAGEGGNTEVEKIAFQHWKDGTWSKDQAFDFLSASGAGFSHNPAVEIAATVALDPQVWGSLGAVALTRVGITGLKLAAAPGIPIRLASAETILAKSLTEAGVVTSRGAARSILSGARSVIQLARKEKVEMGTPQWDAVRAMIPGAENLTAEAVRDLVTAADLAGDSMRLSSVNFLGHLARNEKVSDVVRSIGGGYYGALRAEVVAGEALRMSGLGRVAKAARTIIDPLHAIGGNKIVDESGVDIATTSAAHLFEEAHSVPASFAVMRDMRALGVLDTHLNGVSVYVANQVRTVLLDKHLGSVIASGAAQTLRNVTRKELTELVDSLTKAAPRSWPDLVKRQLVKVREMRWDGPARANLGERMASQYGKMEPAEWVKWFADKDANYLSVLHASTYGHATTNFLSAVAAAIKELGTEAADKLKLPRAILLNVDTLTYQGAHGLLDRVLGKIVKNADGVETRVAPTVDEQVRVIREAQDLYPQLRYISLDPVSPAGSIDRFGKYLEKLVGDSIEDSNLPSQWTASEIAALPQVLRDVYDQAHGAWSFGFRPTDDKLAGLGFDTEGNLIGVMAPWADHVGQATPGYRGTFTMAHNALGMPIADMKGAKVIDYMEAATRTLKARVSGAMVTDAARTRFITSITLKHPSTATSAGVTETEASRMFNAIVDVAGVHKVAVRGLDPKDMWEAVKPLIPRSLVQSQELRQRDILLLVLDAYEGDFRFVGVTQKFTGRAKTMLSLDGRTNFAGQVSEDIYQKLKFKWNPLFQTQEKLEPFFLGGARGVNFAFGNKLNATDRTAARIRARYSDTGVMGAADHDIAELDRMALHGTDMEIELNQFNDQGRLAQLMDVQGTKRLNELRTWEHTMGKSMKKVWEQHHPGEWDRLSAHYSSMAGHLVSDDEVAMRMLTEQMLGSDVRIASVIKPGDQFPAFKKAISTQEWHVPASTGELKGLDLPFLTTAMQYDNLATGKPVTTVAELRAALADHTSGVTMKQIAADLTQHGAHPDYIRRVDNALNFHWDGFWATIKKTYGVSTKRITQMQDMFGAAAKLRGMTPVDYISQVWSPVLRGKDATVTELDSVFGFLTKPGKKAGDVAATEDELLRQMVDIFHSHIDPSLRDTMLDSFAGDLTGREGLIQRSMDLGTAEGTEASQEFQRVYGSLTGADATGMRADPWTPASTEAFKQKVLDRINGVEDVGDADVERAVRYFSQWSKAVLQDGMGLGKDSRYAPLLTKVTGIPTDGGAPYNQMHQLVINQVGHAIRDAANDAFRLQYFAQTRTFAERSINHPFFGIYPASYMWGKILPEVVRFMAKEPFGLRTGAAAYAANDIQKAIAIQREFDPTFEAKLDELGHSAAGWFLGYMMPTMPQDVGSAFPGWLRDLAQQGLDNQARVDKGQVPKDLNLLRLITKVGDVMSPIRSFKQVNDPLSDIGDIVQQVTGFGVPESTAAPAPTGPAATLQPILEDQMQILRDMLSAP